MSLARPLAALACLSLLLAGLATPAAAEPFNVVALQRNVEQREYRFPVVTHVNKGLAARVNQQLFTTLFPAVAHGVPPQDPVDSLRQANLAAADAPHSLRYRILRNDLQVFAVEFRGEVCGAYCEDFSLAVAFETATGRRLTAGNLFSASGLKAIRSTLSTASRARLERQLVLLRARPHTRDTRAAIALYEYCLEERYRGRDWPETGDLQVTDKAVTFNQGECGAHVNRSIDEVGALRHTLQLVQLHPWLSDYGRSVLLGELPGHPPATPLGQLLNGTLGAAPARLYLQEAAATAGDAVNGYYFLDRDRLPVPLQGSWQDGVLSLQEPGGATLRLRLQDAALSGEWKGGDGRRQSVHLAY